MSLGIGTFKADYNEITAVSRISLLKSRHTVKAKLQHEISIAHKC